MRIFKEPLRFEWDEGNRDKNLIRHGVTNEESEEVFFDPHKRIIEPPLLNGGEERYLLIGRTQQQRLLFVVFTMRGSAIRVISARNLGTKERRLYDKATEGPSV